MNKKSIEIPIIAYEGPKIVISNPCVVLQKRYVGIFDILNFWPKKIGSKSNFGHFLPNWHPWEDYRKFYASKKETGAAREVVPFELIWIIALFSKIKFNCLIKSSSPFKVDLTLK